MSNADRYLPLAIAWADHYQIEPALLAALVDHESSWNPRAVNPSDPSYGLGQVLLTTAQLYEPSITIEDLFDPDTNLDIAAHYLRDKLDEYGGDYGSALAAYNAGTARRTMGAAFVNQPYVDAVLGALERWRARLRNEAPPSVPSQAGFGVGALAAVALLLFLLFGPRRRRVD